jgi:hypothetical protein
MLKIKKFFNEARWFIHSSWIFTYSRTFLRGVKSIIQWTPVMYKDRDWDFFYILVLLEKKLLKMADFFEKYGVSMDSKKEALEMREVAKAIRKVMEDDYLEFVENSSDNVEGKKRSYEIADSKMKEDIDFIFESMKKNIRKWWD